MLKKLESGADSYQKPVYGQLTPVGLHSLTGRMGTMTFSHETGSETGGDGYQAGADETGVNLGPVILPADSPVTLDVSPSGVGSAENLDQIAPASPIPPLRRPLISIGYATLH